MKKICIFPALLSVLIFMLCACDTVPNASKSDSQTFPPLSVSDISVSIPKDFSQTSTEKNDTAYICDNASIIINQDYLSSKVSSLHAYVTYSKELYQRIADKYTEINQEEENVNGLDTVITEFSYEIEGSNNDNLSMTCIVGFYNDPINKPGDIYIVTCKSDSESYPDFRDNFLNTLLSVSLNQGESYD